MRPVALLSDFGHTDHYVGVMHAVLCREAPGVERFDLGHDVPPGEVWTGCHLLRSAWGHLPPGAVVLAVVDPGVGTGRRGVAARFGDRWLVAPDNGLATAPGAADAVRELDATRVAASPVSATFHGRDVFAPAAARLARGDDEASLGPALAPTELVGCPIPEPVREGGVWRVHVLHVDRFGNVVTSLAAGSVRGCTAVEVDGRDVLRLVGTFAEAGADELVVLEGSSGWLELVMDRAPAARRLGVAVADGLVLRPCGGEEP